ncbi:MAG: response regulator [Ignavibacteria bacterium]|nr:response regulator [Ignavibacteria bacterium]
MAEYSALIIDDDIWMQRILSKTLASYGFKTSYLASDGYNGIALAVEHQPTLIIIDILMPELSGHQTLKILKHIKNTKHIPVIMVSALSDVENLGLAVKNGISGFISKPFTRATVYDKLVDIFGTEKLEMIMKGIPIDPEELYVNEKVLAQKQEEMLESIANIKEPSPAEPPPTPEEKTTPVVKSDTILKHYQEDEKKSIESIKKLLLKNRK